MPLSPAEKVLFNRVADKSDQYVAERRKNRKLTTHLRDLTNTVTKFLEALDAEMAKPSSHERGGRIAQLSNALNMQNDMARRFGLGAKE